jgi:hypothetical protein
MRTFLEDIVVDREKRELFAFGKPLGLEEFLSTLEEVLSR